MDIQSYLTNLASIIQKQNGKLLAKEMNLIDKIYSQSSAALSFVNNLKRVNVVGYCNSYLGDQSIGSIAALRLSALIALVEHDYNLAFRHILNLYDGVLDYFSKNNDSIVWFTPLLVKVSSNLRDIAIMADEKNSDINYTYLRESLQSFTRGFTNVNKDKTPLTNPNSRKRAVFAVTNVLFKVYFKLNTLQYCGKLINLIEGPVSGGVMENLSLFPVSDVAMYKYYLGRLKMFEDRYEESRDCLRFALRFTPKYHTKNRQKVLASLVPIEMCLGMMPSADIGKVYGLHELVALGNAAKSGDIRSFNDIMLRCGVSFVKIGVYLVLEQVKMITYRNLFKKIYLLLGTTRLKLQSFQSALKYLGEDIHLDEIEFISKTDPFPTSQIIKSNK